MNDFNELQSRRQNYAVSQQNEPGYGRIKTPIHNYSNNQKVSQQIVMTKNPTDIKSLKCSCLLTENNIGSPSERIENFNTFANYNSDVCQAFQGMQKSASPEVFENIYLKQSYQTVDTKHKSHEGQKIHTTSKLIAKASQSNTIKATQSPPKDLKSQSLSTIKKSPDQLLTKTDRVVIKHQQLTEKSKTKPTNRSPPKKCEVKKATKVPKHPIEEIIKKYIKLKRSKSKTQSKSPESKEKQAKKRKSKNRKRNEAIHQSQYQGQDFKLSKLSEKQLSPKYQETEMELKENRSPALSPQPQIKQTKEKKKEPKSLKSTIIHKTPTKITSKSPPKRSLKKQSPPKISAQEQQQQTAKLKQLIKKTVNQMNLNKERKISQISTKGDRQVKLEEYNTGNVGLNFPKIPDIIMISDIEESKSSSLRLNTQSDQKSLIPEVDQHKIRLNDIYKELNQLSDEQIQEFQLLLKQYQSGKKDEALQTSICDQEQKKVIKSQNATEQHIRMATEEFPSKQLQMQQQQNQNTTKKELLSIQQIEDLCQTREQSIKIRVSTQLQAYENMLQQQKISPRSYHQNKQLVQSWQQKQKDQLGQYKEELHKAQKVSEKLIKFNEQDITVVNQISNNQFSEQQNMKFTQSISLTQSDRLQLMDEDDSYVINQKQLQVSPVGNIMAFDSGIQINSFNKDRQQYSNLQIEQVTMMVIQQMVDEVAQEICTMGGNQLVVQQQQELPSDKLITIQTNLGVINDFINALCQFIIDGNLNGFMEKMNYPYGNLPFARLRYIHSYEDSTYILQHIPSGPLDSYLFQQLQSSLECVNQFETIHNRAIFDAFNETLNVFRPFYNVNGLPYPWSCSERQLTVMIINRDNIYILFEKVKQKLLEFASSLCGLLSDEDDIYADCIQEQNITYTQALQLIQLQENDYVGQIREERLQKVLLQEISDTEYKWSWHEDDKAEALIEVTDMLFEDLIEDMLKEIIQ